MLEPAIRDLAKDMNFATICVHLANGQILSHVMWVDADDEHVLFNTEVHRAKYRAIAANPSVTVTIWDVANPYRYAEVRGHLAGEVRGAEARANIDALARKYTGKDYASEVVSERVILQIAPDRQRTNNL